MNIAFPRRALSNLYRAILFVTFLSGTDAGCAFASQANNAVSQINALEETLTGETKVGLPLLVRVDALETLTFGQPASGPLKDRIARLLQYIGTNSSAGLENADRPGSVKNKPRGQAPGAGKSPAAQKASGKNAPAKRPPAPVTASSKSSACNQAVDRTAGQHSPGKTPAPTASSSGAAPPEKTGAENDVPPINYPPRLQKLMVDAISLYHDGKKDEARSAFEHILALYPDCVDACFDLGSMAEKSGDIDSAVNYYSRAQYLAPEDEQIHAALSHLTGEKAPPAAGEEGGAPLSAGTASKDTDSPGQGASYDPPASGNAPAPAQSNSGQFNRSQAFHMAVNAGRSILFYTLNRALSSIH